MTSGADIAPCAAPGRFGAALAAGLLLWLAILLAFSRLLEPPSPEPATPPPVEAKIIELPPPRPAPHVVPAVSAAPNPPPRPAAAPHSKPVPKPRPKPLPVPHRARHSSPSVKPPVEPAPAAPAPHPAPPPPAPVPRAAPQAPPETSAGTAFMGAKAIYQPAPKIPDDLRDEAISLVALARFHIKPDGSADVELIKATSSPRANQLILNTLKTWKFFPALEQGKPVASVQDVRIHIDVS